MWLANPLLFYIGVFLFSTHSYKLFGTTGRTCGILNTIKNFRSIRNETIEVKNFNIFVGLNDAGKSNFLKALNLFFNTQTDYSTPFDFQKDFTYLFPKKSHSTKEIKIIIKFSVPSGYKEYGIYIWEKAWRTDNYFKERITTESGDEPSSRSRIPGALKRIKYRYVPAVKSKEYYKSLLSDLYVAVSSSLTSPLRQSTENFSLALKDYTKHISDDVISRLHITSELSIPDNLSDIFKALIFKTSSNTDSITIPLDFRGDGIQARHIPIILKYIADEDQKLTTQGSTRVFTIWGFEEPENGIELTKAFDMADEFSEYSEFIQLFVSTHSPAFYMKKSDHNTSIYFVTKKSNNDGTSFSHEKDSSLLSSNMGLMPLIAPFVADKMSEIKHLIQLTDDHILNDKNTILVEGKTDKEYLDLAIKRYSPQLDDLISKGELRIFTKEGQGGTSQLIDWAKSWIYSGNKNKICILFDKDEAGIRAKNLLESDIAFKEKKASVSMSVQFSQPSKEIISLYDKKIYLFYEIEHLLSIECWKKLKEKNYVIPRDASELLSVFSSHFTLNKPLETIMDETVNNYDLLNTIVTLNPKDDKKEKIINFVSSEFEKNPETEFLNGMRNTVDKLTKLFVR